MTNKFIFKIDTLSGCDLVSCFDIFSVNHDKKLFRIVYGLFPRSKPNSIYITNDFLKYTLELCNVLIS